LTLVKGPDGILKMNQLESGDLVFSDHYESPLLGRQFSAQGNNLTTQKFYGGTIFCDAPSRKLTVVHQAGQNGTGTVQAKLRFESEAASVGVNVRAYCTNNGVYTSKELGTKLASTGQGIKHSGVGAGHHRNGVAENAINNTVPNGRTIMIYGALPWPENNHRDIWLLALSHAVSIHNELPSQASRLTPHPSRGLELLQIFIQHSRERSPLGLPGLRASTSAPGWRKNTQMEASISPRTVHGCISFVRHHSGPHS
jgi:hypothetical protein